MTEDITRDQMDPQSAALRSPGDPGQLGASPPAETQSWLDRKLWGVNWELALYLLFITIAIVSRFVNLGARVQSHDESLHTRYAWELYDGQGFSHTPLMHGPFLFHATALSYWLFGDNDATARVPVAILGVILVALPYLLRRHLGRAGALGTSFLLLISPSLLYYSRYLRMDIPVIVWSMILVISVWSYLRNRREKYLYWFAGGLSLMFATKEVAFLYVAIVGSFLTLRLVVRLLGSQWPGARMRGWFLMGLMGVLVGALVFGVGMVGQGMSERAATGAALDPAAESVPSAEASPPGQEWTFVQGVGGAIAAVALALAVISALVGMRDQMRGIAEFDLIVLFSTLLLPFLAPVPLKLLGADPLDYSFSLQSLAVGGELTAAWICLLVAPLLLFFWHRRRQSAQSAQSAMNGRASLHAITWVTVGYAITVPLVVAWTVTSLAEAANSGVIRSAAVLLPMLAISAIVGLWWDRRRWLGVAGIFYTIFTVLFTTVFTNGQGFATGWIGSLGYWLVQQEVQRGGQPSYFYLYLVPIYEFLPLIGAIVAGVVWAVWDRGLGLVGRFFSRGFRIDRNDQENLFGFIPFVLWWTILTWALYSYAGEKMGWLTVHFAIPMILLAGWSLGRLLQSATPSRWETIWKRGGWALVILSPILLASLVLGIGPVVSGQLKLGSQQLDSLIVIGRALGGLVVLVAGSIALVRLVDRLSARDGLRILAVSGFAFLSVMTIRAAWMASYINYDTAKEHMVYAHGGPGTRLVMEQIEEISMRMNGDLGIRIAFDNDVSWPFWWYLRNYPNKVYFAENPSRDSLDVPIALVGDKNWAKVDPYVGNRFHVFEYTFVWWPMEDYKNLTWDRLKGALTNPEMRVALWDILVNRDYTRYAEVTGRDFSLASWPLRHQMRLYVRKDVAAQLWDYGVGPSVAEFSMEDPYEEAFRPQLLAAQVIGEPGQAAGQLQAPRGIALGPDDLIYVTDSGNHRIQVFRTDGQFVRQWGGFCDLGEGGAGCVDPDGSGPLPLGAGQFKEPWGVAVAADGTVYVADTWNHRIQSFSPVGEFLQAWGHFRQVGPDQTAGDMGYFYGPRDVAISSDGLLYVTDTGNKRVQVFGLDGSHIDVFGQGGPLDGQIDEPVGLDIGPGGLVYVADTWNGRVDVFDRNHNFLRQFPVEGWFGQSVNNKPFLATDLDGRVYVTDPELYRVLVFDSDGEYQFGFGQYSTESDGMALPTGIAVGEDGTIYVSDAGNNRVLGFVP